MSNFARYIPKINDRDVLRAFEMVKGKFSDKSPKLLISDNFGQLGPSEAERFMVSSSFNLSSVALQIGPHTWNWNRLRATSNDKNSATYDTLTFSLNQQLGAIDRDVLVSVSSALDAALAKPLVVANKGKESDDYIHSKKEILGALESAVTEILVNAAARRDQFDSDFSRKEEQLAQKLADQRRDELEQIAEKDKRLNDDLSARREGLDKREKGLSELQKKLDDRNNTHVRRDIRSSLLQLAKERLQNFSVSKETRIQYWAVHIVSVIGIVALSAASLMYGSELIAVYADGKSLAFAIALAIKSGLTAAAAITLGAWYLRWLNRWLQRIADAEFKLQQFRLDIERASWLAETVLEWKSSSTEPFPELLAARLSAGLFASAPSEVDDPQTPAAHLANALFGAAASAKIKIGDQEIVFDRKSITSLESQAD